MPTELFEVEVGSSSRPAPWQLQAKKGQIQIPVGSRTPRSGERSLCAPEDDSAASGGGSDEDEQEASFLSAAKASASWAKLRGRSHFPRFFLEELVSGAGDQQHCYWLLLLLTGLAVGLTCNAVEVAVEALRAAEAGVVGCFAGAGGGGGLASESSYLSLIVSLLVNAGYVSCAIYLCADVEAAQGTGIAVVQAVLRAPLRMSPDIPLGQVDQACRSAGEHQMGGDRGYDSNQNTAAPPSVTATERARPGINKAAGGRGSRGPQLTRAEPVQLIPQSKTTVNSLLSPSVGGVRVLALVFVLASRLPVGKLGPIVHVSLIVAHNLSSALRTLVYNSNHNDCSRQRMTLSAAASAGIAGTLGAPLSAILFCLESMTPACGGALGQLSDRTWGSFVTAVGACIVVSRGLHFLTAARDANYPSARSPEAEVSALPCLLLAVICGALSFAYLQWVVAPTARLARLWRDRLRATQDSNATTSATKVFFPERGGTPYLIGAFFVVLTALLTRNTKMGLGDEEILNRIMFHPRDHLHVREDFEKLAASSGDKPVDNKFFVLGQEVGEQMVQQPGTAGAAGFTEYGYSNSHIGRPGTLPLASPIMPAPSSSSTTSTTGSGSTPWSPCELLTVIFVKTVMVSGCHFLPVPFGVFLPTLVAGAAVGRLFAVVWQVPSSAHSALFASVGAACFASAVMKQASVAVLVLELNSWSSISSSEQHNFSAVLLLLSVLVAHGTAGTLHRFSALAGGARGTAVREQEDGSADSLYGILCREQDFVTVVDYAAVRRRWAGQHANASSCLIKEGLSGVMRPVVILNKSGDGNSNSVPGGEVARQLATETPMAVFAICGEAGTNHFLRYGIHGFEYVTALRRRSDSERMAKSRPLVGAEGQDADAEAEIFRIIGKELEKWNCNLAVGVGTTIDFALDLMERHQKEYLFVEDENKQVCGLLHYRDFFL